MDFKRRRVVLAAVVAAIAGSMVAGSGQAASQTDWYWTPGLCKSKLRNQGVTLADGRYFYAAQASCVGKGGPNVCAWSASGTRRMYRSFGVIALSYDGVARGFDLHVTGKHSARIENVKALGRITEADFAGWVRPIMTEVARIENQRGCAP